MAGKKLSMRQARAAALIASGMSHAATAREMGITPKTISMWKREKAFMDAIDSAHADVLREARDRAIGVFLDQLDSPNEWLRQNAASRALAQYNAVFNREQDAQLNVTFTSPVGRPGMPDKEYDEDKEASADGSESPG